jgi:predicted Fe-Mo cluster-binding NifX family protein
MKICFPVEKNEGLDSVVYNHFGSAPMFVVVDTETSDHAVINNKDQHHVHGACNPLKALDSQSIHAVIVGGIGGGALNKLNQMGITVHRAQPGTVRENMPLFVSKQLPMLTMQGCCGGHSSGGNCAH